MPFNPAIHHRSSIRLKGFDYSKAGLYFVTVCVQHRKNLFGSIKNGIMIPNDAGIMIQRWYFELENKFPDIKCCVHIIMPNHIHFIIENLGYDRYRTCASIDDGIRISSIDNNHADPKIDDDIGILSIDNIRADANIDDDIRISFIDNIHADPKIENDIGILSIDNIRADANIDDDIRISSIDNAIECRGEPMCSPILDDFQVTPVDNMGERFENMGERYDHLGERFENMGEHYDHLGERFENMGENFVEMGEHIGSPLHRVMQWFSTMTTNEYIRGVKTLGWERFDKKLWQRNYWEHIIRNESEYKRISNYIIKNPKNW